MTNEVVEHLIVDGKKYYVMFTHPHLGLKVLGTRWKYKNARHIERYNRWAKSQRKPPYAESIGELGTLEGVTLKASTGWPSSRPVGRWA